MTTSRTRAGVVWVGAVALVIGVGGAARADVTVTFTQNTVTGQTTMAATGSLNTSAFGPVTTANFAQGTWIQPSAGVLGAAQFAGLMDWYQISTPFVVPFGGGGFTSGTFTGPDYFAMDPNGSSPDQLFLPGNYVSGSPLSAGAVFGGTFASLGITPTDYSMTLPGSQAINVHFASVPGPGVGIGGLMAAVGLGVRRRRGGLR